MRDISKYQEIIIWGASFSPDVVGGVTGSHGYAADKLYRLLDENGYSDRIIMWVDSNTHLHGRIRFGKKVYAPSEILKHVDALIIINSISVLSIMNAAKQMGANNDVLLIPSYFYNGTVDHPYNNKAAKNVVEQHGDEIKHLFMMEDDETKRCLDIIFEHRNKCMDDLYSPDYYKDTYKQISYFCDPELAPKGDVTLVDVGAFEGDSIEPVRKFYGEKLKSCIAFEPGIESFEKLKDYAKKSGIDSICKLYRYALGEEEKKICFAQTGVTSQQSENGDDFVEQKIFDDLHIEKYVLGKAMIKMDIEGAEESALLGMKNFITKYKPYLAICIYHKETDIYRLPQLIKSFVSDYRLYIRGGWHVEVWAVPND